MKSRSGGTLRSLCKTSFLTNQGAFAALRSRWQGDDECKTLHTVPYLQDLGDVTFQQDNARLHAAHRFLTYLDTESVPLLHCLARSLDL
ncbi:hypothetical protein TNCV_4041081 [Trichonephila clavipes]|nr:hypothetical protein TNCV_4041081 [Trichonephila clavipes]